MKFPKSLVFLFCYSFLLSACSQAQDGSLIAKDAKLRLAGEGYKFTEGPAADALGNIYFTDQPNNQILKWWAKDSSISVFKKNAGRANGLYIDRNGHLLACADENSQLWLIDEEGEVSVLVSHFEGKRLNGPNDLWVDPKGGIYITDPYYQRPYWERTEKEIQEERVYYLEPGAKELKIVANDLIKPNGIIGTPDGKLLYVADIEDDKTWSYTIEKDGSLTGKTLFTNKGSDGMTIDELGNIYITGNGVTVFNREGTQIEHIAVDKGWTANVTFGGKEFKTLFITAMDAVFTLEMTVKGAGR